MPLAYWIGRFDVTTRAHDDDELLPTLMRSTYRKEHILVLIATRIMRKTFWRQNGHGRRISSLSSHAYRRSISFFWYIYALSHFLATTTYSLHRFSSWHYWAQILSDVILWYVSLRFLIKILMAHRFIYERRYWEMIEPQILALMFQKASLSAEQWISIFKAAWYRK